MGVVQRDFISSMRLVFHHKVHQYHKGNNAERMVTSKR